ncbi:YgcG family protein [Limnohabitans sp.]|uniref:TPM domain-containing protein n=1 Tax=Limnohabitans sp. TaxID=1907725 RepID=UPI0035AFC7E8
MNRTWGLRALLALLWALGLGLWQATACAQTALVPVPDYRAHVTDTARALADADRAALERQLANFETQRGTQIGVLIVPSTAPEDIADYSQRVADAWKLGRAGVGDGLLIVVAVQDRRVRIAPFKALEGAIPDVLAKRIIDQQMVPAFRRGDYAGGLRDALAQLQAHITGEALPEPAPARPQIDEFDIVEAAMLLLVAVPLVTHVLRQMLGQRLGSLVGAAAAGLLVWQITGRIWMALLAGLMGFFVGLFTDLPMVARDMRHRHSGHRGGWHRSGDGWGGGGFGDAGGIGGGGASSGGGGDGGGGGASGSW